MKPESRRNWILWAVAIIGAPLLSIPDVNAVAPALNAPDTSTASSDQDVSALGSKDNVVRKQAEDRFHAKGAAAIPCLVILRKTAGAA